MRGAACLSAKWKGQGEDILPHVKRQGANGSSRIGFDQSGDGLLRPICCRAFVSRQAPYAGRWKAGRSGHSREALIRSGATEGHNWLWGTGHISLRKSFLAQEIGDDIEILFWPWRRETIVVSSQFLLDQRPVLRARF